MNEKQFLECIEQSFDALETAFETNDADLELTRLGNRLTLEFEDGSKIIISSQAAMQELWVATQTGGFHYRYDGTVWRDTRTNNELFSDLESFVSRHQEPSAPG